MKSSHAIDHIEPVHSELKIKYKEFFESSFAIHLLNDHHPFHSVNQISSAILNMMMAHQEKVIELMRSKNQILTQLKEPFFGALFKNHEEVSAQAVFFAMLSVLEEAVVDLRKIMQIHCIFIHYIYDELLQHPEKQPLVSTLFCNTLFSKEMRKRVERPKEEVFPTTQFGISHHPVFCKKLGQSDGCHIRAADRFSRDPHSLFFQSAKEKNLPVVCGASGHTGSLMLGAKLYGALTDESLREYALISFAFLAAGGNHSFHEVMVVAALIGVAYEENNYLKSIPASVQEREVFSALSARFPEFLSEPATQENDASVSKCV